MKKVLVFLYIAVLIFVFIWVGKRVLYKKPEKVEVSLQPVAATCLPVFSDDLNGEGLKKAISAQIEKLKQENLEQKVKFGDMFITRERILKTLEGFLGLLEEKGVASLDQEIPKNFFVFQSRGLNQKGDVLFTGYYQPVLDARTKSDGEYQYPLYQKPPDLQVVDLEEINPKFAGEKIGLRIEEGKIKPYFDRKAIDKDLVLRGKGLELVFLKDFLDRYMLQVQGSGVMKVENGQEIKVGYAVSNCFPYTSLREILVDKKKLRPDQASLKKIREYFKKNPKEVKEYLYQNRRYIFFEKYSGTIKGSERVALTPGRSIATDKTLFPGGGLAFIQCRKPILNAQGEVLKWEPMVRFMLDQDTGAAIKGPGRVDLFWGTGKKAGDIAGSIKEKGKLFYLLIKEDKE